MALYAFRYPPSIPAAPDVSGLDVGKLLSNIRALLSLVVVNLAALGATWPLERCFPTSNRDLQGLLRISFGLFALGHVVLLAGLLGHLSPRGVTALVLVSALLGSRIVLRLLRLRGPARPSALRWTPAAWLVVAGMALPFLIGFIPSYGWDALTYHLALPERFLRAGRIAVDPYSIFTTFPLSTEMLYTLALPLGGPTLAKLLNFELGILLLAALASSCGRASRVAAVVAPLCLLADPLFLWETTVVYSDLALALLAVLATHAVLEWDEQPERSKALSAAALCGLCAGVRYPGAGVAAALAIAIVVAGRPPLRNRLRLAASLGIGSALGLAPWFLRNLADTGTVLALNVFDPLYLRQLFDFNHEAIGMGRSVANLLASLWNVTLRTLPGLYTNSFGFQVGPLYLFAGVVALVGLRRRGPVAVLIIAAAAHVIGWFYTVQEARYLLPALVTLAMAGALAIGRLAETASSGSRLALGAVLASALALGQLWLWNDSGPVYRMALGDISWRSIVRAAPVEEIGDELRGHPDPRRRVLALFEPRTWHLRGVDSIPYHFNEASPTLVALHQALSSGRLCEWMREQRVTHIVANALAAQRTPPRFIADYSATDYQGDVASLDRFLATSALPLRHVRGTTLFELRPPGECQEPTT